MSAPDTNIDKQEREHRPALVGIGIAVGFAALLFVGWLLWVAANGQEPTEASTQMDDFTAQPIQTDAAESNAMEKDTAAFDTVPAGSDAAND